MNPGATYLPPASMVRAACAFGSAPTAAMRPPCTAMSAGNQGLPVPSSTRAFLISRS